jgi:chromosomal replication initiator protein
MAPSLDRDKLWQATLGELELALSKANFTTWFKNTFILEIDGGEVVVGVPNAFTKAWLENKYHKSILSSLQRTSNGDIQRARYMVAQLNAREAPALKEPQTPESETPRSKKSNDVPALNKPATPFGLNPRYTFESFIVGKANQLAHAAAQAVCNKPGEVYNPLFVYGGSGMGKTHLMQAIGHQIKKLDPSKQVLYVPCERFTNEFISSISRGQGESFKTKYRNVDVLLIDDVQFLSNKEGTQEEFFHTFNALHQTNKQIVLSSDRPPKAIRDLEERLVSRFEWGMLVDLPQPDLETRMAILESKCRERSCTLTPESIAFIAQQIQSNIREMEGILNRIIAYHNLNNTLPSLDSIKGILQSAHQVKKQNKALSSKDIISIVVNYFDISTSSLLGASRQKGLVVPRQIAMYLLREELKSSYPSIGRDMGDRDHTTAMHAYEKIRNAIDVDEKIRRDILQIKNRLYE